MKYLIWFILIAVALFFVRKFLNKFKVPKVGAMAIITGGVKTGKTTLAVAMVMSEYKKRIRNVKFYNFFAKIFKRKQKELPLIYSNIPLTCDYVPLTDDLLLRKKRFVYGSVIYVCEASLVADSQLIKDMNINQRLLMFNKLIGHELHGGCIIYDTQTIQDCHYSIKRCLSEYIYIHHLTKWLPFVLIAEVQECRYSDDGSTITVATQDVENTLRKVLIRKSTWKKFDCYCYSALTDNLEVEKNVIKNSKKKYVDLKARKILSFRGDYFNEKENNN